MGNPETHVDNLKHAYLERQDIKNVIQKEVIVPIKGDCTECYKETLENLNKHDVASLIVQNYTNNGKFLPYEKIEKNYTYALLVQTGLAMLGYDIDIDALYASSTKRIVQKFEKDNDLTVDIGLAGPDVLKTMVSLLNKEIEVKNLPIISIQKVESQNPGKPNIAGFIQYVSKVRGVESPLSDSMIVSAAESIEIPLITPELMTSIIQHETGLGTHCIKKRNPKKGGRFSYYNVANIQYRNPRSRQEGVSQLANYLKERYDEFKTIYSEKEPTVTQLLQNQGPDGKGFLPGQANYKKPNPTAHGAYCADEGKGERVGDQIYPGTIATTMRKIENYG